MAKKKKEENSTSDNYAALQQGLSKMFGESEARSLSSEDSLSKVDFSVSTRSIVIDKILAGGRPQPCSLIPFGRQMEISGLNGAGKTTLCAQIAAETQKRGGLVVVVDTEERIDETYWKALGVNTDRVINLHAGSIEEVFDKVEQAIKISAANDPDQPLLIIWDSVGGTSSDMVLEGKGTLMERAKKMYGREAKIIGTGVKALNGLIAKHKVCFLYTNHLYTDMNVTYGDNKKEYGGEKLKFHATVRLRLTKVGELKEEDAFGNKQKFGQRVKIKANKNSMGPMQLEKEAVILGGIGFCNDYTVFEIGKKSNLITTAGAWSTVTLGGAEVKFMGWNGFQEKVVMHDSYMDLVQAVVDVL